MYQDFFGLKEAPFSIAPNPHYLYMSKQHHEALAHLVYGVGRDGGFVLLTGEVGTGKTTICRCFLEQIPPDTDVAFILNPKLNVDQLLAAICDEFGISYIVDDVSIKELVDCINSYLLNSHAQGRHTVLIIDEAQNLSPEVLEQLRLLTNLETHEKKLLQIVLLGQPELQEMFLRPDLRQLAQRVTARFHLKELQLAELGPYVRHRLSVAGGKDIHGIFPEKTLKKLYTITTGVPRIINLVCDRALLGAYSQNQRSVDTRTLEKAAREILGPSYPSVLNAPRWIKALKMSHVGVVCAVIGVGIAAWWVSQSVKVNIDIATLANPADTNATDDNGRIERGAIDRSIANDGEANVQTANRKEGDKPEGNVSAKPGAMETLKTPEAPSVLGDVPASLTTFATLEDEISKHDILTEAQGYKDLYALWNITYDPAKSGLACKFARAQKLTCLNKVGSLGYLRHLGLPALVTLFNKDGKKSFGVLRRLDGGAITLRLNGTDATYSESEFNEFWRGHFTLLWRSPEGYNAAFQPGTITPVSRWLRQVFADLDKQPLASKSATYDPALVERVKAFQRSVGEVDDGVVGEVTLIQLLRRLDGTMPLLTQEGEP